MAILLCGATACVAADVPDQRPQTAAPRENGRSTYYWQSKSIGDTAQLLTLFCHSCRLGQEDGDVPLVAVLRDTVGDNNPENDRVTYVWLLTYARLNAGQRLLSAVPFFYWRVGSGSKSGKDTAPLMDLTAPMHPVLSEISRDLLQWTTLDPLTMPVRASSRAYRTNSNDYERLHLQEAIGYLRQAPYSDSSSELTHSELDTVIARLELRTRLLGGFASQRQAERFGAAAGFEQERIRSRNWELLRQCAERTGLLFEPLTLAGTSDQYAVLWLRLGASPPVSGVSLGPVWKLLNIKDPWEDERVRNWRGPVFMRALDESGSFAPDGFPGARQARLMPLAVYSLNYPKLPLLLVDFRDKLHVRRHEMTQRAINEITSGVIGISHFTNWYYYVAADLYDFVVSRHGAAMDTSARLDCYSQFRVELALDHSLNSDLRSDIQIRVNSLAINPLEGAVDREVQVAKTRYELLEAMSDGGKFLADRIDKERRAELADFGESKKARAAQTLLHDATFGVYTHRVKSDFANLAELERERRIQYQLNFLDSLAQAGPRPEVIYESSRIRASVNELSGLMAGVRSKPVRAHAATTLAEIQKNSADAELQSDCSFALAALKGNVGSARAGSGAMVAALPGGVTASEAAAAVK
ncbi:MAG: hypothetical protein JO340_01625 [Acidobacteriaceae bacterium]|nr:hypothetical protein [Acidobacteriaceae bacterium]